MIYMIFHFKLIFRAQRKAKGDHGPIQGQDQDQGQGPDQGQGGEVGAELLPDQRNENQGKFKFTIFILSKDGRLNILLYIHEHV